MEEKKVTRELLFKNVIKLGLTRREQEVISLRYGLVDGTFLSMDEVALEKGITREEVNRIEKKALLILRNGDNIHKLRQMMENENRSDEISARRSRRNIYTYYGEYSEELVDTAISLLTDEQKALIERRYGSDLKNPEFNEMRNKDLKVLNNEVFGRIDELLVEISSSVDEEINDNDTEEKGTAMSKRIKKDGKKNENRSD